MRRRRTRLGTGAHPRSRGENTAAGLPAAGVGGSSPLTRGKPPRRSPPKSRPGLIPAHAGKTRTAQGRPSSAGAHPRSRGENPIEPLNEEAEAGSSPLTRGKQGSAAMSLMKKGLIPAHAGKTTRGASCRDRGRAHPRSRGENGDGLHEGHDLRGSSPLTRGKLVDGVNCDRATGLIPAHAGKTTAVSTGGPTSRAHPRSRGENSNRGCSTVDQRGSSPLTRGKLAPMLLHLSNRGLIPAHAGKTGLCGSEVELDKGSSPLTRGKLPLTGTLSFVSGLIPAHAGKTYVGKDVIFAPRAHPRSRGENEWDVLDIMCNQGSSPLTRGKRS